MIPRIFPFLLFIAFIAVMDGFRFLAARGVISFSEQTFYCLYPIRSFAVLFLLLLFFPRYNEIDLRDVTQIGRTAASILIGLIVFILWIHMDWNLVNAPDAKVFNPDILSEGFTRATFVILRMFGLVVIVPVMEEIFWRSFLIRYIIDHDFMRVPMGRFTWPSFIISTILFGLEHHLILAGMMAGAAYNILLYRTKSIAQCIIAHAVTNLALGIYILCTGKWHFW
jgi:hypothetical protein